MHRPDDNELIERISAELRSPVQLGADFDERVMASIRRAPRGRPLSAFLGWLLRPRRLELSPLAVAAAASVVLLAVVTGTWELARRDASVVTRDDALESRQEPVRVVQFVFVAPSARSVALVGDFNGWDTRATQMQRRAAPGVWTVSLPLPVGRHQYAFVINETDWAPDPTAPPAMADDFGTPSSVVTVALAGDA